MEMLHATDTDCLAWPPTKTGPTESLGAESRDVESETAARPTLT